MIHIINLISFFPNFSLRILKSFLLITVLHLSFYPAALFGNKKLVSWTVRDHLVSTLNVFVTNLL